MNCPWVRDQILLYLYKELDDPERIEIEQHLERCSECSAEVERERALHRLMDRREHPAVSLALLASCRARLAEALEGEPRRRWAWGRFWGGIAALRPSFQPALAALLLLVGFLAGWGLSAFQRLPQLPGLTRAEEFNLANISSIHSISTDPTGQLEVVFDTTRRRVLRGTSRDPRVEQLLVYAAKNYSNPGIRLDSIELLKDRVEDGEIRGALVSALRADRNAGVRLKALQALKNSVADEQVRQALLEVLRRDDNPGLRIEAIDQLSKLRDASTVPLLQQLAAGDPNNYVRLRSASALRELNAPEIF